MNDKETREFGEGVFESREVAILDYPHDFPAEAAGNIGRAVLARDFNRSHLRDAWIVQGYAQGIAFPVDDYRPVTPAEAATDVEPFHATHSALDPDDDDIAEALVNVSNRNVGANETGLPPLPWKSIVKMIAKLVIKLI